MIPPFLITKAASLLGPLATKVSSPFVKWGLIAAVLLLSNLYTWHHTTLQCEKDKTEAVAAQAKELSHREAQAVAVREEVYKQKNEEDRIKNQRIIDLQKRLVTYERNAKKSTAQAPPDSVSMFNAISSLLPTQDDLPGTNSTTGKSDESPEARIEVTRLLLAYVRAYADCATELKSLWDDYEALVQTIRAEYKIKTGEK